MFEIKDADDLYGNHRTAELGRSHDDFREPRNRKEGILLPVNS